MSPKQDCGTERVKGALVVFLFRAPENFHYPQSTKLAANLFRPTFHQGVKVMNVQALILVLKYVFARSAIIGGVGRESHRTRSPQYNVITRVIR